MLELRSTKPAAPSQPYRVEPELRSLNVPLDVDVPWLIAICRVEEKPIWTLPMDRWHKISVSLCTSLDGRRGWLIFPMSVHVRLATEYLRPDFPAAFTASAVF